MKQRNAFSVLMGGTYQRSTATQLCESRPQRAAKAGGGSSGTQLHLDLGQRDFAVSTCAVCGMLYGKGLPEEERLHDQFHNAHGAAFKFPGWVSERVLLSDGIRGRLLCVMPGDPKPQQRKVGEVCGRLEAVLGLPQGYLLAPTPLYKVFLWVSSGGGGKDRITGCLVAQLQEGARWAQLMPVPVVARPGSRSHQHQHQHRRRQGDRDSTQQQTRIAAAGATVPAVGSAAEVAPVTPCSTAAAPAEAAVDAVDEGICGGGGGAASLSLPEGRGEPAGCGAGGVARGAPRASFSSSSSSSLNSLPCAMKTPRDTGRANGVSGEPEAEETGQKRPRLQELTHGSSGGQSGGRKGPTAVPQPPTRLATAGARPEGDAAAAATPVPGAPPRPPPRRGASGAEGGGRCEGAAARVVLGVRGLWVEPGCRRKGVGSRLVDAARCSMVPGVAADRTGVAFSAVAAAAAAGDNDGGAAFTAFAASYIRDGGSRKAPIAGGGGGGDGGTAVSVLLYDDEE